MAIQTHRLESRYFSLGETVFADTRSITDSPRAFAADIV
jgi:hypothetical protein